jgi:glycolate oxidase
MLPFRAGAVILPNSAEEVQSIIKVCNRFKIKNKAMASGWGVGNMFEGDDVLIIDLRRMNRILEIDEKNMYAVVEPYVLWGQLQCEIMKLGFNTMVAGVGVHTSALANCTSTFGMGSASYSMGVNERNVLGVEWVLPNGEMLKMGALGSKSGWFCGDGPGPSLRGVMRGEYGALGGLGIITKCAIKLYDWPCPATMPIEGTFPEFKLSGELPENMKIYLFTHDSVEAQIEAASKLGEAEVGYHMYCWGYGFLLTCMPELRKYIPEKPEDVPDTEKVVTAFSLITSSPSEMEYSEKVLNKVLADTKAESPEFADDPIVKADVFRQLVRSDIFFAHSFFGFTGGGGGYMFDYISNNHSVANVHKVVNEIAKKWQGRGMLLGCYDCTCTPIYEFGHESYIDGSGSNYDPTDRESIENYIALSKEIASAVLGQKLVRPTIGTKKYHENTSGPMLNNFQIWQKKIKSAFDPNYVSDATYYIEPE